MAPHHLANANRGSDRRLQYAIWKLRHALSWRRVAPFLVGGAVGVPIGTVLLAYLNPTYLRVEVGALLMAYSLVRPAFKPVQSAVSTDVSIGFLMGCLGVDRSARDHRNRLDAIARMVEGRAANRVPAC